MIRYTLLRTVLDPLLAVASEKGLVRLEFLEKGYEYHTRAHAIAMEVLNNGDDKTEVTQDDAHFEDLRLHLAAYFTGDTEHFSFPLDMHGSPFQLRVWRKLKTIPYGKLRSYKQIAVAIGAPGATRAVGQAAGMNPLPVVVPCHRVVGSNGDLVGYAGGLPVKARLLKLEGHTLGESYRLEAPRLF
jgi:O-6-methylguanine DNA methyltransferase